MDPHRMKITAEWFRNTVFKDEALRPAAPRSAGRLPSLLRAARSLENGSLYQSRGSLFMKQGKLLANYEDDYDFRGNVLRYYPTYQSLTDQELRGYFSWRTRLRGGDLHPTSLSFVFLHIYELINQIGVDGPMDGYRKLTDLRDAYGPIDGRVLPYLERWLTDYVVYYGLDADLLSGTAQAALDRSADLLEHIREADPVHIIGAVKQIAPKWLERSRFYAEHREEMDACIVRVLRRVWAHCDARCKKSMVEQYVGACVLEQAHPFGAAVFCDPLKRRDYEYTVDEQWVYRCENGIWSVRRRAGSPRSIRKLEDLLKTIDSVLRAESGYRYPVKAPAETKWILRAIREEYQSLLAEKSAAGEKKITIDYSQLVNIRRDAAVTQEKLIVDEEAELPDEPAAQAPPPPPEASAVREGPPLSGAEYRLLHCLLYGGDIGWVRTEGHLPSVLADGINEKLYDVFLDSVVDGELRLAEDYIADLKEMVRL